MKKIYALIITLALFCMSWAVKAQETLTVYLGNEDNSTINYYVPAYIYYFDEYTRSQFVIPAADLAEMSGATISSITFYTYDYNIPYTTESPVDVYLKEVPNTTISNFVPKAIATTVYQGTLDILQYSGIGILTIEFNTPFTYTGGNLMIGIDNTTADDWEAIYFYGQEVTGASIAGSGSNPNNITATQCNFIPTTTFEYIPAGGSYCPKPTNLTVNNITNNSAVISWTETGDATTWYICIDDDEDNLILASNPYTLTGLNPETSYSIKVRSDCGAPIGVSNWSTSVEFTTEPSCIVPTDLSAENITGYSANLSWNGEGESYNVKYGILSQPVFFDDFEDGLDNWTIYTEGESVNGTGWYTVDPSINLSTEAISGSYVASAWSWNSNAYDADNWLVTPLIPLQGILKFWVKANAYYPDQYEVLLSTQGNAISNFTVTLQDMVSAPGEWEEVSIDLSAYAGQNGYIAIHHADYDENYLLIDNFGIYPPTQWITTTSSTNNIALTGLTPETQYQVQVQSNCGTDGLSAWSSVFTFTTDVSCPAPNALAADNITGNSAEISWNGNGESYSIRYRTSSHTATTFFDDFENDLDNWTIYTEGESLLGDGWFTMDLAGSGIDPISGDSVACAFSYFSYGDESYVMEADNWLVTPQISLQDTLKFWVISNSYYPEHYSVLLSTTGNTISDFTTTLQEYGTAPGEWTQVSIDLSSYAGQNGYIAIHHADTNAYFIFVDDFGIFGETTPAGDWMTASSTTAFTTLTGLNPETTYEVQVMSNCGEDGQSVWSDSYLFTTSETSCDAPTALTVSDITLTGATLSWTESGDATAWQISLNNDDDNLINITENSTYSFNNLTPGTEYVVKVRAHCGEEFVSVWSYEETFTTLPEIIPTVITIEGNTTVCPGELTSLTATTDVEATYLWNNGETDPTISVTQGTYTVTVTSSTGNELSESVTVTAYPTYDLTDSQMICESALPFTWNGITFTEAGTQTVTLSTVDGCDSIVTMTLMVNPVFEVADTRTICDNEFPYEWNGVTFTEAGTQAVTLTTVNNCDSVVNMTLNVNPVVYGTDEWTICSSELPYTWNGITFNAAGTKFDTLTSANNCDSIVTMTLFVIQSFTATDALTICASELPYEWNGVTFTAAGTQDVTLTAVNGCDSVVTMTLNVNPIYSINDNRTVCTSGLPYTWNGITFTEAGTETVTLESVNGCDSTITMTLSVSSAYEIAETQAICINQLPYEWNGVTFTEAGTQEVTLEASNGCDSIVTMTLNINPIYNVTDAQTICASELPYTWNGVEFTEAGTQTATLQTINGCDSVVVMTLTVNPIYNVTDAYTICASELPYTWNGIEFIEAGTQTATLQTINGCDSVVVMTLTVNPIYNVTDAQTICTSELPYIWNGVEFTEAGTQSVTLETVNGCDSVVVMTLTVNPIYNVTDAQTICISELPYTWNGVTFTEAGTQTATLQTINGCDSVVVMTLTVNPIYNVTDAQTICASELPYTWNGVIFTEAGTQSATLQTVNGCDSVVVMTLAVNPIYNVTDAYTICESELPYTWNGVVFTAAGTQTATLETVNGCDSMVVMTLTVNPTYSTLITEAICPGETFIFFDQSLTTSGTYTHTLQAVTGCDSVIILNLTVNPTYNVTDNKTVCESELPYEWNGVTFTEAGTQNVTLQAVTGCDSVVVMTLTMNPTYNITESQSVCEGELPYTWNGVEFTAAGTQTVTLTAANGCDSVVTMTLAVNLNVTSEFTIETPDSCYEWNGQIYCESGDYTQTLTTVAGCDSVVTLHLTTSVGVNNYEFETNVYIAPNPAKNVCRILGLSTEPKFVEIYDMRGGLVMRTNDTEFDVRTLSTGFYMVKVYTGERVINLKLVKE